MKVNILLLLKFRSHSEYAPQIDLLAACTRGKRAERFFVNVGIFHL
jgi:hypothetical protein